LRDESPQGPEPSSRHRLRFRAAPLAGTALGLALLAAPQPARADAAPPPKRPVRADLAADTTRAPLRLHFKGRLLQTQYLDRALRLDPPPLEPDREARLSHFVHRYRISRDLAGQIHDSALAEGIDPELAFRLIRVESRFHPRARSRAGALGLTQLMPGTARRIDPTLRTDSAIVEPHNNLRVGFRYLRRLIEMFDGDVRLGVLAYNRGEGNVMRALRQGRDPENGYSRKVLGTAANRYSGSGVVAQ
jgi:soluble lytic murein transglycosylase-like protein